ncbi:aminotransferase class I/II-fold pyridoxal phosphate-dependent enzyme [Nocardia bovistercoris]|nr:aminotransferase class I/II-fold pyridoxal phosphate-dependent enzyme [Nocardia bovistercoris]
MVKQRRSRGESIIAFNSGEPLADVPSYITDAASIACRMEEMHRYTDARGLPSLRKDIVSKCLRDSGVEIDIEQVNVSNGAKQAIYEAVLATVGVGDEAIVLAPYWPSYIDAVALAGGTAVVAQIVDVYDIDSVIEKLDESVSDRTRLVVFSNPCNPSGRVFTADEMARIGSWATRHGVWVLSDEIYEHMNYVPSGSLTSYLCIADSAANGIVINGVAKSYSMTGWRVGWSITPPALARGIASLRSQISSNVCNISQFAAASALSAGLREVALARDELRQRRDLMVELLSGIDGVSWTIPDGGMYVFARIRDYGDHFDSTVKLAEYLLDRHGVATVPGEAFGCPGYLRLSFSLPERDIHEGVARLRSGLEVG